MFEFFIALFGGSWFVYKCIDAQGKTALSKARRDNYRTMFSIISNKRLELEKQTLFAKSKDERVRMLEEIKDDLVLIFGDNYLELYRNFINYKTPEINCNPESEFYTNFELFSGFMNSFSNIWCLAFDIWMAKHGVATKTRYDTKNGLMGYHSDGCMQCKMLAIAIIEKNMRDNHSELDLHLYHSCLDEYEWHCNFYNGT